MVAFPIPGKPIRCAVYTRKSSEEGLEQSFNSLHAQREACEAYILSQKHEGWTLVPTAYDDGGFSGGSMERPGLKALMTAVEDGLIDTVVVYKVDRLTRSLADFAKMVEQFDARSVSFVSVTQAFNTTTSMGRLTLNVLLSFAQFEREVTGERIRDKIAASKAKGMWMGGSVPLGYTVVDRLLIVDQAEAEQVRTLFKLYLKHQSVDVAVDKAFALGIRSKQRVTIKGKHSGGDTLARGSLYSILANPLYVGEIGHKGQRFKGQHDAIVDRASYDAVQALLETNRRKRQGLGLTGESALLSGLVVDADGTRLTSTHTNKAGKRYRYYAGGSLRLPANDLEEIVTAALVEHLGTTAKLATLLPDLAALNETIINVGRQTARTLKRGKADERRACVAHLVERVQVTGTGVTIDIQLMAISAGDAVATIVQPATIGRAKATLSLVVPGKQAPKPDHALITMVAQARGWLADLTSGRQPSLKAVATTSGVTPAYVRHIIGASFLAPDLVTAIVEGRQPAALTAANLKAMLPLPADWDAQRAIFAQLN